MKITRWGRGARRTGEEEGRERGRGRGRYEGKGVSINTSCV